MSITTGYTTATVARAYAEGVTAGVYTWPSYVNTALVTNVSGQLAYVKLLTGDSVIPNPYKAQGWAEVGAGDSTAGMFTGTALHYDLASDPATVTTLTQRAGTLVVGKHYVVTADIKPRGATAGDVRFTLGTGGNILSFDDNSGRSSQVAAASTATTLEVLFNVSAAAVDVSFAVEQVASAVIGEYDLVIPDGETIDITRDSREAIYGFSVWVPDTGLDGAINARGRVTPGRNKVTNTLFS